MSQVSSLIESIAKIQNTVDALDASAISQDDADELYNAAEELQTSCNGLQGEVEEFLITQAEAEEEKETDEKDSEL